MADTIPAWVKHAVFYQIFPDRFARSEKIVKPTNLEPWDAPPTRRGFKGGDFIGMRDHLDYLVELGINAIYFNPIFQSAANHRYHTHDYYHVDPILGGDQAFLDFLNAAHAKGIRVMLDGVFNHASRGILQFNHIMENGEQSPYFDWFIVNGLPLNAYNEKKNPNYACWWDNRELPKLNTENPQVRAFIYDVAEYWLKLGIDGWRLDVPLEIKTPGFWEEFRDRVKRINPEAYILAEIWDEAVPWLQGAHFDAVMNYGFNRACYGFFGGEKLDLNPKPGGFKLRRLDAKRFARQIDRMLNVYDWEHTLLQLNLLSSHDEPRFLTMVARDKQRLRLATIFQMTYPGTPSIYYGDEIGMEGGDDPDCRRAFSWDAQYWDHELLEDFRKYIALRHAHSALRTGSYTALLAKGSQYAFARSDDEETLVVAFNTAEQDVEVSLSLQDLVPKNMRFHDVWSEDYFDVTNKPVPIKLPALAAMVFVCKTNAETPPPLPVDAVNTPPGLP